jgi:hypothetical protein
MPRIYEQNKSRFSLVVRELPDSKDVNTEAEEATELEAVTRRKPQQMEKN